MIHFLPWLLLALVAIAGGLALKRRSAARRKEHTEKAAAAAAADAQRDAARQREAAAAAAEAQRRAAEEASARRRAAREAARLAAEQAAQQAAAAEAAAAQAAAEAALQEARRVEAERLLAERLQAERLKAERLRDERLRDEVRRDQAAPIASQEAARPVVPSRPDAPRKPRAQTLVMIADDSKVVRVKTGRLLAAHDYQVCFASDGLEAARQIGERPPDVLITDVEMPGMDGFALTEHVRRNPAMARMPVIMVTAAEDRHRDNAARVGVSVLLGKPYSDDELIASVEAGLGCTVPVREVMTAA